MLTRILAPLDGSAQAEQALAYAERLTPGGAGRLILVRVTEPNSAGATPRHTGYLDAQAYVCGLAVDLGRTGHAIETSTPAGDPASEILEEIRLRHADLVVMATHGRSGPGRWLYGSVADAVLRGAQVPVVLVPLRSAPPWPLGRAPRILLPLDGSSLAEAVLPVVSALAASLFGAETILVQAVAWPPYVFGDGAEILACDSRVDLDEARAYLTEVTRRQNAPNTPVRWRVELGRPAVDVIARVARQEHVDLVAMATHGRGGLSRLLLGSVASGTLQRARVPVLMVRPRATSQ